METAAIASASVAMGGRPLTETAICATLEHQFAMEGDGARPAYPCVVAGGTNANTLHYVSNSQVSCLLNSSFELINTYSIILGPTDLETQYLLF
jgi:Xaa-Pro aminopeptidase